MSDPIIDKLDFIIKRLKEYPSLAEVLIVTVMATCAVSAMFILMLGFK